ncbi:hypothetical protein [Sporosarcina pasteurii]|uniref:Resolvase HTH domain-containing protein n=1 Tax=Sporosarcina pasteurii TaxID=1474 RepID=A0A380BPH3_SPOPA|nr:hypothetical protein [Sporosarcina pasteurii]MDS9471065.1 hypothetical protein [Sporosarcina pasteurii]QBQ05292.1 hypothetical protein E2C16_06215 [Sporosarcina pasteurii]SUJ04230.1 Uncharacterised protein [Sporosarcina pasteurii]
MDLHLLLIAFGIIIVILSFFVGHSNRIDSDELEKISISLHQETNGLKKRLKALEEELMMSMEPIETSQHNTRAQPVHEIIVNQILSLNSQGFSIEDIAKRSSLTSEEVIRVLQSRGVR